MSLHDILHKFRSARQLPTVEEVLKKIKPLLKEAIDFQTTTEYFMEGNFFGSTDPYLELCKKNEYEHYRALLFLNRMTPETIYKQVSKKTPKTLIQSFLINEAFSYKQYEITEDHWRLYFKLAEITSVPMVKIHHPLINLTMDKRLLKLLSKLKVKKKEQVKDGGFVEYVLINWHQTDFKKNLNADIFLKNMKYHPTLSESIPSSVFSKQSWVNNFPMLENFEVKEFYKYNLREALLITEKVNLRESKFSTFAKELQLNPALLLSYKDRPEFFEFLLSIKYIQEITKQTPNLDKTRKLIDQVKKSSHYQMLEAICLNAVTFHKILKKEQLFDFLSNSVSKSKPNVRNEYGYDYGSSYIYDTVNLIESFITAELAIPEFRLINSMEKMHDFLSAQRRKINMANFSLGALEKKKFADIHGVQLAESKRTVCVPKDSHELIDWGESLHNCVGSAGYAGSMKSGHTLILGLKNQGEIEFCVEIKYNEITQFEGKYRTQSTEIRKEFREFLIKHKIIRTIDLAEAA